ncbi:palmitoyltransferase ZDHHC23-like isoform X2 [Varroa jacobsoni]|uniref:Palmitoyltransferase n=1 Tax=Varroa destructor TaxID=109461 RepID=A0A7M7K4F9_VARDE|nr:palmitoyltransferase ZDHHC23-like isoform X2 [Varroa destructor]XP_022691909.1 palmitoyltransferase ZDHHC23-like isoform X2 [Varroa jacobsoni]
MPRPSMIPVFSRPSSCCGLSGPIDRHVLLAIVSFFALFWVACQGWWPMWTSLATMLLLLGIVHGHCHRKRLRSRFFLVWGLLSYFQLLLLLQLAVVPQLKVLFSENMALTVLVLAALYCAYRTRTDPGVLNPHRNEDKEEVKIVIEDRVSAVREGRCAICLVPMPPRTSHCLLCGVCIQRRDHHCIWLDTCIGVNNHRYFILGLITLAMGLFYGANLTLTSLCQPMMFWGMFLVPRTCPGVFGDWLTAWVFTSAVYSVLVACLVSIVLLQQLIMVACNTTVYEIRKYQQFNGSIRPGSIWNNCLNFWIK